MNGVIRTTTWGCSGFSPAFILAKTVCGGSRVQSAEVSVDYFVQRVRLVGDGGFG